MNEQIKELLDQCQIETYGVNGELLEFGFDAEKFAELIVQECGNWIVDHAGAMEHLGPLHFAKAMQKDFGVEE